MECPAAAAWELPPPALLAVDLMVTAIRAAALPTVPVAKAVEAALACGSRISWVCPARMAGSAAVGAVAPAMQVLVETAASAAVGAAVRRLVAAVRVDGGGGGGSEGIGGGGLGAGAALFNRGGTAVLVDCTFDSNTSQGGTSTGTVSGTNGQGLGVIFNLDGGVAVSNPTYTGNTVSSGDPLEENNPQAPPAIPGASSSGFTLAQAELNLISGGSVQLGRFDNSPIEFAAAISRGAGIGNLIFTGAPTFDSNTDGADFTTVGSNPLAAFGSVNPGGVDTVGELTVEGGMTLGSNVALTIDVSTAGTRGTDYDAITTTSSTIFGTGVTLSFNAINRYTPSEGDQFTIIQRADIVSGGGTFDGLANGATVSSDFMGSGRCATMAMRT